jgi:hypothetical protein
VAGRFYMADFFDRLAVGEQRAKGPLKSCEALKTSGEAGLLTKRL